MGDDSSAKRGMRRRVGSGKGRDVEGGGGGRGGSAGSGTSATASAAASALRGVMLHQPAQAAGRSVKTKKGVVIVGGSSGGSSAASSASVQRHHHQQHHHHHHHQQGGQTLDVSRAGSCSNSATTKRKPLSAASRLHSSVSDVSRDASAVTSVKRNSLVSATSGYQSNVTSYTLKSSHHPLEYHRVYTSHGTINDTMTSASSVASNGDVSSSQDQELFGCVDVDRPALHVWRAEAGQLIPLDSNDHGFFHEGACYLVLKVWANRFTSLHYWLGQQAIQHDARTVERFSRDVDDIVQRASILSKEVQFHESEFFLRNFPDGVIYVEGKAKHTAARTCQYAKRLYVIKGLKFVTATCREPHQDDLDSTGAALLDGFPRMYLWLGARCHPVSRTKAMEVARKMRDGQRKGKAHIVVVEESDAQNQAALLKKLNVSDKENQTTTTAMTNGSSSIMSSHTSSEEQSSPILNLHRVSGDRVLYDMPFAATTPLMQRFLVTGDSYLLDRGPHKPLCVWVGAKADNADLFQALRRGQSFSAHRGYPSHQAVCRIMEGNEPPSFKMVFLEWREKVLERSQLSRSYSVANIGRALFSRSDPRTVAKTSPLIDSDITLCSDGETETFRVDGESLEAPLDQPGVLLNSDCYVIWHRPDPESIAQPLPRNVLFYWLGSRSEEETKCNCLRLCLTIACAVDEAVVIRVLDDKEPQSLLSVFHNSMVVYDQDVLSTGSDTTLFFVKECAQGSMRVQQVPVSSSYLNSSAALILLAPTRCILWFGELTGGSEREFAKTMLGFLDSTRQYQYDVVMEGKEPDFFWDVLGPKVDYEKRFPQPTLQRRCPRMSLCKYNEETEDMQFEEITDFCQQDLSEADVFILDVFDAVMLWCGRLVDEESRKQMLPKYLKEYISRDPATRNESEVQVWLVSQGDEPEMFRRYFPSWSSYLYGGEEAYSSARKALRQDNAKIDVDEQMVDKTYTRVTHHSYKALLKTELPPDTLREHREHHLSDKQFQEALKMTRFVFYRLPDWKQAQLLRSARLAHFPPAKSQPSAAAAAASSALNTTVDSVSTANNNSNSHHHNHIHTTTTSKATAHSRRPKSAHVAQLPSKHSGKPSQ